MEADTSQLFAHVYPITFLYENQNLQVYDGPSTYPRNNLETQNKAWPRTRETHICCSEAEQFSSRQQLTLENTMSLLTFYLTDHFTCRFS